MYIIYSQLYIHTTSFNITHFTYNTHYHLCSKPRAVLELLSHAFTAIVQVHVVQVQVYKVHRASVGFGSRICSNASKAPSPLGEMLKNISLAPGFKKGGHVGFRMACWLRQSTHNYGSLSSRRTWLDVWNCNIVVLPRPEPWFPSIPVTDNSAHLLILPCQATAVVP